ncbi:MAG: hypothetical protein KME18_07890 [Phormidium tanganyikae FI6-MK23]|jgi:hypothetical protein|nr:hypothetical protein [Phormidium tanganyikae FI6-MK23]
MSLVQRLTTLQSKLLELPRQFGVPQYQHSIRVIQQNFPNGSITPIETVFKIAPNPKVQPVPTRLVGSVFSADVVVSERDLLITDLVRLYTEADLLNGDWEVNGVRGYRLIQLIPGTTTYSAILRAPFDSRFSGHLPIEEE